MIRQDLTRIDDAIADGTLAENPVLRAALAGPGRVHLLGLVSDGGVHSSLEHLLALLELARQLGAGEVVVHCFTDGRDTRRTRGSRRSSALERQRRARIGSVVGRYYAMDRDRRWDRVAARLRPARPRARAAHARQRPSRPCAAAYERGETDEFIEPTLVGDAGADRARRPRVLLQLPPRPDARDRPRARRPGVHRVRPRRRRAGRRADAR